MEAILVPRINSLYTLQYVNIHNLCLLWNIQSSVSVVVVTEEEIYRGILSVENVETTCYWFKRTLDGLADSTGDKLARRFMDIANGQTDEEALKFLTKLKYALSIHRFSWILSFVIDFMV